MHNEVFIFTHTCPDEGQVIAVRLNLSAPFKTVLTTRAPDGLLHNAVPDFDKFQQTKASTK